MAGGREICEKELRQRLAIHHAVRWRTFMVSFAGDDCDAAIDLGAALLVQARASYGIKATGRAVTRGVTYG